MREVYHLAQARPLHIPPTNHTGLHLVSTYTHQKQTIYHQTDRQTGAHTANMPIENSQNQGVTGAAKFVTSTVGNTVGGLGRTVGNVTGAAARGVGDTITGATGSAGKPVGDALGSVGTGIQDGANSVSKGVENAGQWRKQ